jgi:hypothetical protein
MMSRDLIAFLGIVAYLVFSFTIIYVATKPPKLHHFIQFRVIFGYRPAKNVHLRAFQEKLVWKELKSRAVALNALNAHKDEFLRKVKAGEIAYSEAEREIPRVEREALKTFVRFQKAQRLAALFGYFNREYQGVYQYYLGPNVNAEEGP